MRTEACTRAWRGRALLEFKRVHQPHRRGCVRRKQRCGVKRPDASSGLAHAREGDVWRTRPAGLVFP
eukprot:3479049-Rhodomonas_salina.1